MTPLHVRALIFDLGCTLIEYEAYSWDELAKKAVAGGHAYLRQENLAVPAYDEFYAHYAEIRDRFRTQVARDLVEWTVTKAVRILLERLELPFDDDLVEGFFDAYYAPVAGELFVYDDTRSVLQELRPRYPVIGLISNTIFPDRTHDAELDRFGLAEFFDFRVYSSSFGLRKPHADIFYHAANQAGFAPSECVYIGDRYEEDIIGPSRIGMHAILKHKSGREYPERRPEAWAEIQTLSELPGLLSK